MNRRSASLFQGSEFPRLMILAGVAVAGWPMVLLFAQSKDAPKPAKPAPIAAATLKPVEVDTGIEFQALVDLAPMKTRENAAYAILLDRARQTSARDLAARSRRDLVYTHLWERPERYRGVPIRIEGTALRVLSYEVNPALAPAGRIFEAWVYSDENRAFPYVLAFEDPPPNLVVGPDLHLRVRFDGYFLKLLGYRAGDKGRAAPLLVGRLSIQPGLAPAPAPMVELRDMAKRHAVTILFAVLFGYVLLRVGFQIRRAIAPNRRSISLPERTLTPREIEPEDLADWLATLPEQGLDELDTTESDPARRHRPADGGSELRPGS